MRRVSVEANQGPAQTPCPACYHATLEALEAQAELESGSDPSPAGRYEAFVACRWLARLRRSGGAGAGNR